MAHEWAGTPNAAPRIRDLGPVGPGKGWELYEVQRCKGCPGAATARASAELRARLMHSATVLGHGPFSQDFVQRDGSWFLVCAACGHQQQVRISGETGTAVYLEAVDAMRGPCLPKEMPAEKE